MVSLVFTLIVSFPLFSQFNTYSPYTRFALGDLAKQGFAQGQSMGGTGLAIHENNRINHLNPASFAAFDSTSVYFDFGANTFHNQYETETYSNTWWNMNLHHVAFASSMGKYLGFSAHSVEAALALMNGFDFDTILFPFNFAAWYHGNFGPQVMEEAKKRDHRNK